MDKCAVCCAGACQPDGPRNGHDQCNRNQALQPGNRIALPSVTAVAGTRCCGDCAGILLQLVLHPLMLVAKPVNGG